VDSLEKLGFQELDAREEFPLSTGDWEVTIERAVTVIIMLAIKQN
jgi:hypothetical protein